MTRRFVRRPLPLRLLAAGAVGASLSLVPTAGAQIGPATTQPGDAPEPRFGMFRETVYEGAERVDPVDYSGDLLRSDDGGLTLSLWKGIDGTEAFVQDTEADAAGAAADDLAQDVPNENAPPAGARGGEERSFPVTDRTRVYLNGERAKLGDLRPGDRIRVRGFDRDGSSVERLYALRTDEFLGNPDLDIHPDIDTRGPTGAVPADVPDGVRPGTPGGMKDRGEARGPSAASIKRAAETGVTTPGGGGFQDVETELTGESKENVAERRGEGVTVGNAGGGGQGGQSAGGAPVDGKRAPGFGFVVSDSPGEGVLVADVQPGGPAAEAGVRQGDFLTRMGGQSVSTPEDVKKMASQKAGEEAQPVPVVLWRDGESQETEITPGPSGRDYFPKSNREAMSGSARSGFEPTIGARTRDSESSGVEVLAAAATGALAAEAGEDSGGGYGPGYGGNPYGFYGDDFVDGVSPFDDDLYGGYGYGAPATGYDPEEQYLENQVLRRRMLEARANAASGLDAEDYYSGSYPTEAGSKYRSVRPGDRIVGVNDNPVSNRADLRRAIRGFTGNRLKLNVIRNGERTNLFLPKRVAETVVE